MELLSEYEQVKRELITKIKILSGVSVFTQHSGLQTKALIIKHADKLGTTHITLEVANEGIEQAKGYMEEAMKTGNLKDMIASLTGKAAK